MRRSELTSAFFRLVLVGAAGLTACGSGPKTTSVVIATTEPAPPRAGNADGPPPSSATRARQSDLQALLAKDERRAAQIIRVSMCEGAIPVAAWAAVYARRLGIKHDVACAGKALEKGSLSREPLLTVLSLRWLATTPDIELSTTAHPPSGEPLIRAMTALSLMARGPLPNTHHAALALPEGSPTGPVRATVISDRLRRLQLLASPFDDGPLALALAFVEARDGEWVELEDNGSPAWAALRIRNALLLQVLGPGKTDVPTPIDAVETPDGGTDSIGPLLENRLISQPRKTLRSIAMTGAADLRIESLRAIAIVAREPETGDFAACAAAFESDLATVRVEGARTFLLLTLRIR